MMIQLIFKITVDSRIMEVELNSTSIIIPAIGEIIILDESLGYPDLAGKYRVISRSPVEYSITEWNSQSVEVDDEHTTWSRKELKLEALATENGG